MKFPFRDTHTFNGFEVGLAAAVLLVFGALTITFRGNISDLIAAATSTLGGSPTEVFFTPQDKSRVLEVGKTATIDFDLTANVPINSIGASITYPKGSLEVVGLSKEQSFLNLWTQDTTIKEETGEVDFSGGTTQHGGVTGTNTVLTLTVRAEKAGPATLSVGSVEVYAADGKGTKVDTTSRPLTLTVAPAVISAPSGGGAGGAPSAPAPAPAASKPKPPSVDLDGDGKITIVDASILMAHLSAPYDPRYDFNLDGHVDLSDLSILFSKMQS